MKTFILLISLLFTSFISSEAQITYNIQPVNLAVLLLDESDIEKMAETCEYYNLTREEEKDGFTIFRQPDGSIIRFKIQENENERIPLIEVITKENIKNIKKDLSELNFRKTRDGYIRGSNLAIKYSSCTISTGNPTLLTFTKEKVSVSE